MLIEQQTEKLVQQFELLRLHVDEKEQNLEFLQNHLSELSARASQTRSFLAALGLNYNSNLKLSCIDPLVIKLQYEKLREINESVLAHEPFVLELRADSTHLLNIPRDYSIAAAAAAAATAMSSSDYSENKYLSFLPKTVRQANLVVLEASLDAECIGSSVKELEAEFNAVKRDLNADLTRMHRVYPLCETLALSLSCIGQGLLKCELELDWLRQSDANETSPAEMERQFDELQRLVAENEQALRQLESALCVKILDELLLADEV